MNATGTSFVIEYAADPPPDWDTFVTACEPSHFEQTSGWAAVESGDGWSARYITVRNGGGIAAGVLALVRRQRRIGKVGYVYRGPLLRPGLSDPARARSSAAAAMKEFSRRERLAILVTVPPYDGDELVRVLLSDGFLYHPKPLSPRDLPPGTTTIDLRPGRETVEQGYRQTLRKHIRRAERRGVRVSMGSSEDMETFWRRHQDLCRRRGVKSNVPNYDFARRVWDEFRRRGLAWMFQAALGGEVLCSLICLGAGKWFYAWRIGWLPESEKAYPTQLAFARAIEFAVDSGYHFFDFMEIHPDEVESYERGVAPDTPTSGVTFFKLGFGGAVRKLSPTLDWFPHPILRLLMRWGGSRALSSRPFAKYAGRFLD